MIWKIWHNFILVAAILGLQGCYSFKGASLSADLKTIQINNIRMETAGGPTNLEIGRAHV